MVNFVDHPVSLILKDKHHSHLENDNLLNLQKCSINYKQLTF